MEEKIWNEDEKNERQWAENISEKIKSKMKVVAKRSAHKIPYTTEAGMFDDMAQKDIYWWTNGFWGGMMWQLYNATGEELYRKIAEENEQKLECNLMSYRGMDHDSGFKWLPTAIANYRMTGSEESFNRGRIAAESLAGRFNPVGKFIRAWNDRDEKKIGDNAGWAIIDCMMNLPLLYWAYEQSMDYRYRHIAQLHVETVMNYFVRPDGSVKHIVEFNPVTGEYIKSLGGQGYEEGSSWTRGQAWAIYGFVLSYIHTKEDAYLQCAKRIANYFIANIPESGHIPVDFRQPIDSTLEDSTAAAIAACGMLEIAKFTGEVEGKAYRRAALRMLHKLEEDRCNWSEQTDNILEKCTAAYHDKKHEFSIIYGDYFFIEAIWKLTGQELFIW